jgi:hypothetical protein
MSITQQPDHIAIRPARPSDAERLRWLAQRDTANVPAGRLLVAEVDGAIAAAVAVDGGEAIADPFQRTAELVALLRMRAHQGRRRAPLRIVARVRPALDRATV